DQPGDRHRRAQRRSATIQGVGQAAPQSGAGDIPNRERRPLREGGGDAAQGVGPTQRSRQRAASL
ncbi:hypothetical protein ABTN76_20570, partial [Acinetobacter baumannii]